MGFLIMSTLFWKSSFGLPYITCDQDDGFGNLIKNPWIDTYDLIGMAWNQAEAEYFHITGEDLLDPFRITQLLKTGI